ncbi:MAG: hypothetical protein ACRDZO_03235 [Egibacteraceae bacterium]
MEGRGDEVLSELAELDRIIVWRGARCKACVADAPSTKEGLRPKVLVAGMLDVRTSPIS